MLQKYSRVILFQHNIWKRQYLAVLSQIQRSNSTSTTSNESISGNKDEDTTHNSDWLESRKVDITSGKQLFLFDTYAAVSSLRKAGISTEQAATLVDILVQTMHAEMEHVNKNLVTKPQQEIATQQIMSHIGAVRKDMIILEKSEFSQLKHEYEKQHIELQQLKTTLTDEILKLKSGITLDLNIEKARSREDHADNEKRLALLANRLDIKLSEFQGSVDKINSQIDKEVAQLLVTYERYRNDVIKYAGGTLISCLTICLGFYRLWM